MGDSGLDAWCLYGSIFSRFQRAAERMVDPHPANQLAFDLYSTRQLWRQRYIFAF